MRINSIGPKICVNGCLNKGPLTRDEIKKSKIIQVHKLDSMNGC